MVPRNNTQLRTKFQAAPPPPPRPFFSEQTWRMHTPSGASTEDDDDIFPKHHQFRLCAPPLTLFGQILTLFGQILTLLGQILTLLGQILTLFGQILTLFGQILTLLRKTAAPFWGNEPLKFQEVCLPPKRGGSFCPRRVKTRFGEYRPGKHISPGSAILRYEYTVWK